MPISVLTTIYPTTGEIVETPGRVVVLRCEECGEETGRTEATHTSQKSQVGNTEER